MKFGQLTLLKLNSQFNAVHIVIKLPIRLWLSQQTTQKVSQGLLIFIQE